MKPGQTLVNDQGIQVALFPLQNLNVTQRSGQGTLSHCCGHPLDCAGATGTPLYAPCDCHRVWLNSSGGHDAIFQSDSEVVTPSGIKKICFSFTHALQVPSATSYKQGELIYYTGTAGQATGPHVHIDTSFTISAMLTLQPCSDGSACYALPDSVECNHVFYINDTNIIQTLGVTFSTFSGGTGGENPVKPGPTTPGETVAKKSKWLYYLRNERQRT